MEDKESREEWLMRVGKQLDEKAKSGESLVGEEAEIHYDYILLLRRKKIERFAKTPKLYQQILKLYGLDIPVYVVRERYLYLLCEPSAYRSYILFNLVTEAMGKPLKVEAIVIKEVPSEDKWDEVESLLYWIAKILYNKEMLEYAEQEIQRLREERGWSMQRAGEYVMGVEGLRIYEWIFEQMSELEKYLNPTATGWREGLSFEEVSRRFKPDIDAWRDFFRGTGRAPEDPADRGGEGPPAAEGGDQG